MESKSMKTSDEKKPGRSLKKNLAVAAVAASLGLSLGVPVRDALAQGENMDSPPSYTMDDTQNISSEKINSPIESRQGKFKTTIESKQGKFKSNQGKLDKRGSSQLRLNAIESTQIKLDKQIDAKTEAEQSLDNE